MSFFRKIERILPFVKHQKLIDRKRNEIERYFSKSPEFKEKFPDIYVNYKRTREESELDEMCQVLSNYWSRENVRKWYLERFEKNVKWQELYPQSYLQLQAEHSEEEWKSIKPTIDRQIRTEGQKAELLKRFEEDELLKNQYADLYAQLLNIVTDEEVEKYEEFLQDYEDRKKVRNLSLRYLQSIPKFEEKYAREYELLQRDISREEINAITEITRYESVFLARLSSQYNAYVKELTEKNYATGKVEMLYKGRIWDEEFMSKYPEGMEALIKHYGPEFDEFFFEKDGTPKGVERYDDKSDFHFKDMSFFRDIIEQNQVFKEYVITDREYTIISDKLRHYVPYGAIRGLAGTFTGYSISYENFLLMKERYPQEIASYASKELENEDIQQFINKMYPYLTTHEIQYMV